MSATHNLQVSAGQTSPADYAVQAEKITAPARITTLLKRLLQARTLLAVGFPQVSDCYNSRLLSIQPDHGSMLLDELKPAAGHAHLVRLRTLHIQAQLRGVDIDFSARLIEAGAKDGIALYRIGLPSVLNYAQRRANYRARLGAGERVPVTLKIKQGQILQGHLCDISASGLSAVFDLPAAVLAQGDLIPRCMIRFAPGDEASSALEVRFVTTETHSGQWRVGGNFIKMERVEQNRVEHFVAALDREMRKKDVALK
ncbi:MAG: flagellar brake protein [Gammaproteobacteria bacterium]|nr:flagellar brake protein [Gammaproteobacteria bacterium]